jgi:hypothetical protein
MMIVQQTRNNNNGDSTSFVFVFYPSTPKNTSSVHIVIISSLLYEATQTD